MKKFNAMKTVEIDNAKGYAIISLSTSVFTLKEIKEAAAKIINKAIIMLDGDNEEVVVEIQGRPIEKLFRDFNRFLITGKQNVSDTKKRK